MKCLGRRCLKRLHKLENNVKFIFVLQYIMHSDCEFECNLICSNMKASNGLKINKLNLSQAVVFFSIG
jgi:hypothetical protein